MFEDYFFETTKVFKNNPVPTLIYWMMQFIDFSFHENERFYYLYNNERRIDEIIQTNVDKHPLDSDITNFNDMIKTFRLMFDV